MVLTVVLCVFLIVEKNIFLKLFVKGENVLLKSELVVSFRTNGK